MQWVNPNEDGTYTSPGEGWIEFIPKDKERWLYIWNEDGTRVLYLGEKDDSSPDVRNLWVGRSENASWDIVGLFIPGKLTFKGLAAGASALWAKHLARREATRAAYEIAKAGGKHAGFLRNYATKSRAEIERAIKSIERQMALHRDKIANPEKHIPDWKNLDPRQRDALVNKKWPSDIQRQSEQASILRELLKDK